MALNPANAARLAAANPAVAAGTWNVRVPASYTGPTPLAQPAQVATTEVRRSGRAAQPTTQYPANQYTRGGKRKSKKSLRKSRKSVRKSHKKTYRRKH
jgi:hypothetical protein